MSALGDMVKVLRAYGWPYAQDMYTEDEKPERYIVHNIVRESPEHFADDVPERERTSWQVHMYLPGKVAYTQPLKELKKMLFEAGFEYPEVTLNTIEEKTKLRHICLETGIESEV